MLGAHVFAGRPTLRERLAAVKASVGLLAGVRPLVRRNVALLGEAPWAHGACVGLLPGVRPLVWHNAALESEPHWAHRASVGFLARVGSLVRHNVTCVGEAPI